MNRYATPTALRRALEDRLAALVGKEGGDIQRLRRQAAFDRLLCRLRLGHTGGRFDGDKTAWANPSPFRALAVDKSPEVFPARMEEIEKLPIHNRLILLCFSDVV